MACNIRLQQNAINKITLKNKFIANEQDVLNVIRSVPGLNLFTLEKALAEFEGFEKDRLVATLERVGYIFARIDNNGTSVVEDKKVSNINTIFSSPIIDDLFDTMHIAKAYFEKEVKYAITKAAWLNRDDAPTYTESNVDLNNNIKILKNDLFEKIVRYLRDSGVTLDYDKYFDGDVFLNSAKLYNRVGEFQNYDLYKEAMKSLETLFLGPNNENAILSLTNHKIPNIKGDIRKAVDRRRFDAYNAAILLSNFDNILNKYFGDTMTLDYNAFNLFTDSISNSKGKYSRKVTGETTEYWSEGTHESEGAASNLDQLSETVINMLKHVNKNGEETGLFLDTSDFYSLASFIREFERTNLLWLLKQKSESETDESLKDYSEWTPLEENPHKMLKWYLNKIVKAYEDKYDPKSWSSRFVSFQNRVDIAKSLNNFIESVDEKEKNSKISLVSVLTQLLTNSYGANYITYDAGKQRQESKEMHSHNANRVDTQNSVYSHLLNNLDNIDNYWIGITKDGNLDTELINIEKATDSDKKLSDFINKTLGIYIGTHGAVELRKRWGDKLSTKIQDYLRAIRIESKDEDSGEVNNLLDRIVANEQSISNRNFDLANTPSEVISGLASTIQDIIDIRLDNFILRPIMNISTLTGEKIPTFKLANLMYSDTSVLLDRYNIEKTYGDDRVYKNLFVNEKIGGLLGTSTGLEVINQDLNKSVFKFNIIENFTANFQFSFLDAFRLSSKAEGVNVMIANYADKGTIMSKIIDINVKTVDGKYIIGKKDASSSDSKNILKIDDLLELTRTQSANFYKDLYDNIFDQYSKLGVNIKEGSFNSNVDNINKYLNSFKSIDDFLEDVAKKQLSDPSIAISEELHYSFYNNKKVIALNQTSLDYYRIFNDTVEFNKFAKREEDSLIKKLSSEKEFLFESDEINNLNTSFSKKKTTDEESVDAISQLLKTFGITESDYKSFIDDNGNHKMKLSNGRINPLLKRWMWVNNLFKNEYLFITVKPEFMHPHKLKDLKYRGDNHELDVKNFKRESSARIPNMSKRNVSFTATYENPVRNSQKGEPSDINVATINDAKSQVFNPSGKTHSQDIHDGSSIITYAYSRMIEESYPGKGYNGTKKRIATYITEFGSALKKDAETVLTNDKIRRSLNSPISFKSTQQQVLGTINIPNIESFKKFKLPTSGIYYKSGYYYKINTYSIENNNLTLKLSRYNRDTNLFENLPAQPSIPINNLYDIWVAFGGEYSSDYDGDTKFSFSEGSNELLYDLVTTYTGPLNNFPLKTKMIHIVANHSSFKSGATNINPSKAWTDNREKLAYTTFKSSYAGPQLDAGHEADASKIKEITQIVSALSQNPTTAHIAREVYEDLARIIELSAKPYIEKLTDLDPKTKEKYYKNLSMSFAHALSQSDGTSLAKTIAESFGQGALLPFSNQSFFTEFTRNLITKMNNEFIVRYYNGIAAVLNPSHNIIQIYEDQNGRTYSQDDLMKEAFNRFDPLKVPTEVIKSNEEILHDYITEKFQPIEVSSNEIQPGDTVLIGEKPYIINTIEDYYKFKNTYKDITVKKSIATPRDLKPSQITFSVNDTAMNAFDLESVRLRYVLNTIQKNLTSTEKVEIEPSDMEILNELAEFWIITDPIEKDSDYFKKMDRKLNAWTQRNLSLLDKHYLMKSIKHDDFRNEDGSIDFNKYFGKDTLTNKRFDEVLSHYITNNSDPVLNYKFKPAEIMLPNIYKSTFNLGESSMEDVRSLVDEKGKNIYFNEKLKDIYISDLKEADLKLVLNSEDRAVYIKYVHSFPPGIESSNIFRSRYDSESSSTVVSRINSKGEPLYNKPNNAKVVEYDGYDMVYLQVGDSIELNNENDEKVKKTELNFKFNDNLKDFIKSFKGQIKGMIPLMNNKDLQSVTRRNKDNVYEDVNMNKISFNMFKRFSGYVNKDASLFDKDWFINHREDIINQLGNKMYVSWEKSHELVAARIPAQSMQSFMEMKNVGYVNTTSNDAYVSIWQIWLQGSDFDIDKAYIMAYSFNKSGQYDTWSPIFDYSTKEQLDAIETLPLPSGTLLQLSPTVTTDVTDDFLKFVTYAKLNPQFTDKTDQEIVENNLINLSPDAIKAISSALYKLKDTNGVSIYIAPQSFENDKFVNLFLTILNKHNLDKEYLHKSNSIKNSVVSKIKRIISAPSNQLLANEPVSIDDLHDAGKSAKKVWGFEEDALSMWDMLTMYKQQSDASIGKADVGIGANGLKVFFALSNYYNSYYSDILKEGNLQSISYLNDPKSFEKRFTLNTQISPGKFEPRERIIYSIANTDIPTEYMDNLLSSFGYGELEKDLTRLSEEQAALAASGFVSGATDNAKELVMAKINAVESLASMHLYLIALGYSMEDIAIYMNSDIGRYVAKNITGNVFKTSKEVYLNSVIDKFIETVDENDVQKLKEVSQFKDIYAGAQEFKVLASVLKVNQKTSANINELNKFLSNLESALFTREHETLGNNLINLRNPSLWDVKINTKVNEVWSRNFTMIEAIVESNVLLRKNREQSIQMVRNLLSEASNIEITYIDDQGYTKTKTVSLLGGQFDFRYYMHPKNENYRQLTSKYYNLFKNTINVFDVIQSSPHFKAMVEGVSTMNNVLSTYSAKYNYAFNRSRDIVRKNADVLATSNEDITHKFGNAAFTIAIDDSTLSKIFRSFDNFLISKWLKSQGEISKFRFDPKSLLKLANEKGINIPKVTLFRDNEAKEWSTGDIKSNSSNPELLKHLINVTADSDEDFVVDLTTDYGVANFKILMDEVIFKILQKSQSSNLSNSLKLSAVRNPIGLMTTQITSSFNISDLNSPINMEKFQELLANFNEVDKKVENDLRITNAENKQLKYKDLFYIYNLVVNNEMYGNKRLTPLFEDYIKHEDTVGREYLEFSTKVDSGKVDIFKISEGGISPEEVTMYNEMEQGQIDNILFLAFNKNGVLNLGGSKEMFKLKNSNFILNTSMEKSTTSSSAKNIALESILSILKNNNLIINFNCD